ncbi:DUF262 domain-containing protein [Nostoc sp. FACHB-87]|uniref:GmrSD restriction endonuclease domain-containing protein n=1 Tax=Nostocaceae TaxID=1162 RepID=UPI001687D0F5|nr:MULTISPECIES: DUF262 domain-containing protein [Nostocaceae]MBD2453539.1 DUF262 domain-containing protein [Nostoc sp. FACHB-87]MBD2475664.1 DUF262 domain-containing protein [Anabaena sp. FACHB-83]
MDKSTLTQSPENWEDEGDEILPFQYSITSYGADYPVDGLVKRLENGSIYIPSLQRHYVWKLEQASRFIESLLLGLPVPGIFLSKEKETQKLLVIDGQQRLRTLQYFYAGVFQVNGKDKEFALKGVQPQFEELTYKSLSDEDRRRLDDSIIHATIVNQDEPSEDDSSIYHIFQRLNTGGTTLESQEIRSSIYHGEFNDLLKQLNNNSAWRSIYGKNDKNIRMRDEELILRFLALYFKGNEYKRPLKEFLNKFMGKNRHLKYYSGEKIRDVFETTINKIYQCIGTRAFKPKRTLNASVFDAVMIGVARRLEKGDINDCEQLKLKYTSLLEDPSFLEVTVKTARTSEEENVKERIEKAINAFAEIE